jgi:trk system potassium uptake protein TrkH
MAWPMMASGLGFADALFETVSGVTTTGLTTVASVSGKPATFLFARAWMQWLGGLGIVVLTLAVVIQPGSMAKRLGEMEDYEDDLSGGTRVFARRVLIVYTLITAVGVIGLRLLGCNWFEALLYSFSAVSTGGFAPHDGSLAGLQSAPAPFLVIFLALAGSIPLGLYHRAVRSGYRVVLKEQQLQGLLVAGLVTTIALAGLFYVQGRYRWPEALYHGLLNAWSAQSTAGFSTLDISGIDPSLKVTIIFSMFLGGSIGSTAGGIKILRLLIILRLFFLLIVKAGAPSQAVSQARLGGRRLEPEEIQNALCIVVIFIAFICLSWLPFVILGHDPLDSLFEVVSAIGTVGLSAGITDAALHPFLKGVLGVDMLLGRLEIIAWLVLLTPGTWIGRRLEK